MISKTNGPVLADAAEFNSKSAREGNRTPVRGLGRHRRINSFMWKGKTLARERIQPGR
jgi:hypothetical protein